MGIIIPALEESNIPQVIGDDTASEVSERPEEESTGIAIETGRDSAQVEGELANGVMSSRGEAKASSRSRVHTRSRQRFDEAVQGEQDLDTLRVQVIEGQEQERNFNRPGELYLTDVLTNGDAPTKSRVLRNQEILHRTFEKAIEQENEAGFLRKIGEGLDYYILRNLTVGLLEDATRGSERQGREVLGQMATIDDPEEFRQFAEAYVEDARQKGFFTSGNLYALQDSLQNAMNAGYDPLATFNQVLVGLELVPGGIAFDAATGLTKLARRMTTADTPLKKVAAVQGQEAAAETGEQLSTQTAKVNPVNDTDMEVGVSDVKGGDVRPSLSPKVTTRAGKDIIRNVESMVASGTFGRNLTEAHMAKLVSDLTDRVTQAVPRRVVNVSWRAAELDNRIVYADITKPGGKGYVSSARAEEAISRIEDEATRLKAKPVELPDGTYAIRVEERVKLSGVVNEISPEVEDLGVVRGLLARVVGSSRTVSDTDTLTLAQMAEGSQSRLAELVRPEQEVMERISPKRRGYVDAVLSSVRDLEKAALRRHLTKSEFDEQFMKVSGEMPNQKDWDAYLAGVAIEEASWFMEASNRLEDYVSRNFEAAIGPDGKRYIARVTSDTDASIKVLDLNTGAFVGRSKVDGTVYELAHPENGVTHITKPASIDLVQVDDALGFNPGGRRYNPDARFFITLGDRAFMTSFSEKQARTAVDQIKNIQKAGGNLTDDIVRANTDWAGGLDTVGEFNEFLADNGLDLSLGVAKHGRDSKVQSGVFEGDIFESKVRRDLSRSNTVLMDFGGDKAFQQDPYDTILRNFGSTANRFSFRNYNWQSMNSWVKAAEDAGGVSTSPSASPRSKFETMEFRGVSSQRVRALEAQRSVIRRNLGMKSNIDLAMQRFGDQAAEAVFDGTKGYVKMQGLGDPVGTLLKWGFYSAFGFFNVAQLVLQSSHVITINAISPRYAFQSTAMVSPMMRLMTATDEKAKTLLRKRIAKASGMSEKDVMELEEVFYTSGRSIVDGTAIEDGTGMSWGMSGWRGEQFLGKGRQDIKNALQTTTRIGGKVLDWSATPFQKGELIARTAAMNTSFLEWKAKNPGKSALTPEARMEIARREQDLSFNMTNTGRAQFQTGLMRLPTQWMSYMMRFAETVWNGKTFTPAERIRLNAVMAGMTGTSYLGMEHAAEDIAAYFGVEDTEGYVGIRNGVLDYFLSEATGVDTALGPRISPLGGLVDLYREVRFGEESAVETIAGPAAGIVTGFVGKMLGSVGHLMQGDTSMAFEDFKRALRTPSGLDNLVKAYDAAAYGTITSKNGVPFAAEFNSKEALSFALGFAPAKMDAYYGKDAYLRRQSAKRSSFRRQVKADAARAIQLFDEGRIEKATELMDEVSRLISIHGGTLEQQIQLRREIMNPRTQNQVYNMILRMTKEGQLEEAALLQQLMESR